MYGSGKLHNNKLLRNNFNYLLENSDKDIKTSWSEKFCRYPGQNCIATKIR